MHLSGDQAPSVPLSTTVSLEQALLLLGQAKGNTTLFPCLTDFQRDVQKWKGDAIQPSDSIQLWPWKLEVMCVSAETTPCYVERGETHRTCCNFPGITREHVVGHSIDLDLAETREYFAYFKESATTDL